MPTVATLGGWVVFVMGVGWCEHTRAVALTRMSSTMMLREGMVNPNSRLYLDQRGEGKERERGREGGREGAEREGGSLNQFTIPSLYSNFS